VAGPSSKTERKNMKKNTILGILSAAAVLAFASSANAVTSVGVRVSFNGGAFQEQDVTDNLAGDSNPLAGGIIASFTFVGGVTVIINTPVNASGTGSPAMTVVIGGSLANATDTALVEFSANGFFPPSSGGYLTTQTVNSFGYNVSEATRVGTGLNGNDLFNPGTGTPISTIGAITADGLPHTGTGTGSSVGASSPYSITFNDLITATSARNQISVTTALSVPDGGNTMVLLGSALSVLGGFSVFRKSRKA
jgi:hypothetical protein